MEEGGEGKGGEKGRAEGSLVGLQVDLGSMVLVLPSFRPSVRLAKVLVPPFYF